MSKDIKTVLLSKNAPRQGMNSGSGYTVGCCATIFQNDDGGFGYCYHGVESGGNYFESDNVGEFDSIEEAEEDARDNYEGEIP